MKTLIYCPLNPLKPQVQPRTLESIFAMSWGEPAEVVFGRYDRPRMPDRAAVHEDITRKYNDARRMTLDGGYDALLTIEADMIVPEITLQRLALAPADVVYGLYVGRHSRHPWLAFQELGGLDGRYTGASFSKNPEICVQAWGNVVESKGVGMGCTFIRRNVLEQIEFRCAPDQKVANDWMFALDVDAMGFSQAHDCGVVCGHIDGMYIYWPAPDGKFRQEFLQ